MNPKDVAEAMVLAAYQAHGLTSIKIDVGLWDATALQSLFDHILAGLKPHDLRLKGVRTDTWSFAKLGIKQETGNSGTHKGIPVVITLSSDFDSMEFVFLRMK